MHEVMQQLLTKAEHEKATVYLQMRGEMLLTETTSDNANAYKSRRGCA